MPGTPPADLASLARRYLAPATAECPTFVEDTEWEPIVDGVDYFARLRDLFDRAGPGDTVLVTGGL
ncbi:hypothetical protein FVA95_06500 [Pseudonocardia sp. EV170527-09]|uniref:hypothetical protein n=1 Tax=Pseudonocardia sp. EV170527-09 TaxID=2603411 RepID=UPI0011F26E1A|nr:hypothetical protein [Pseudonocardia sp. EV170527-09]KAA1033585.1 hypothetical protein FVA95_06500 [Pseudonocardia sp. EV170527-09]